MFWYPIAAAITGAFTMIMEKKVFLRFKEINPRSYAFWLFAWVAIIGALVSPWFVQIHFEVFDSLHIWALVGLAFLAANYNLLYYYGLRYEKVSEIEPFLLFNPILVIVIAGLFYPDERSIFVYIATFIAVLVLGWSHLEKKHLKLNKAMLAIIGFAVLAGFEAVIIKYLLTALSPLALYLFRAIVTALFIWVVSRGNIQMLKPRQYPWFWLVASLAIVASVLVYTSFIVVGITVTKFVLLLSPVLIYWLSVVMLKERLKWKNLVASVVMVLLAIWLSTVN